MPANSDLPLNSALVEKSVQRYDAETASCYAEPDRIAVEIPVALQYNGISHAALLASPTDLQDLAYGFSFTEGIIRQAEDIYDVSVSEHPNGYVLDIAIASACLHQLKQRRRQIAGRTGCGLCGLESLDEVQRPLPPVDTPAYQLQTAAIFKALQQLRARQPLHQACGATHAAALATLNGEIQVIREDVGRHNALDKLIGYALQQQLLRTASDYMTVVSSRASFEMVQKTAAAQLPSLIAVSAPTSYAIDLAQRLNLVLVGFGRQHRFSVYSHAERVASP